MFKLIIILIISCIYIQAEPINQIGKVSKKEDKHIFVVKIGDKNVSYQLPDDPRKLFVKYKGGDTKVLKEHEGLILTRWTLKGEYEKAASGNKITKIESIEPKGPGFLKTQEMTIEGILELNKNNDGLISFNVITADKTTYFLPAKKFKSKPSDCTADKAAKLKGAAVKIKAKVQIRKSSPHRVATLHEFQTIQK